MTLRTIETERLVLRDWNEEDLEPFALLNSDRETMRHFPSTLSRAESDAMVQRIRTHIEARGYGLWAVAMRDSGKFIGFTGLMTPSFEASFMPCVEIGWRFARHAWGEGYATEAARAALTFGFEILSLEEIVSFTASCNTRSIRVMQRLGMRTDPNENFDHPRLPEGHPLRRHVLYRIKRAEIGEA
ncbi:MAG: GNAT family N-acetyltransferase [Opitutaceae bacterium]|jgi:RimJ/RimL family protein N-acetyltransferase